MEHKLVFTAVSFSNTLEETGTDNNHKPVPTAVVYKLVTATATLTRRLHNREDTHSTPSSPNEDAPVRAGLTSPKGGRVAGTVANAPAGREPTGAGGWPRGLAREGPPLPSQP